MRKLISIPKIVKALSEIVNQKRKQVDIVIQIDICRDCAYESRELLFNTTVPSDTTWVFKQINDNI